VLEGSGVGMGESGNYHYYQDYYQLGGYELDGAYVRVLLQCSCYREGERV
jgi:hypothetical protein